MIPRPLARLFVSGDVAPVGHAENDSGTMKQNDLQEIGFVCPKNAMNLSPGTGLAPFGTGPAAKRRPPKYQAPRARSDRTV